MMQRHKFDDYVKSTRMKLNRDQKDVLWDAFLAGWLNGWNACAKVIIGSRHVPADRPVTHPRRPMAKAGSPRASHR